jgi:hypothetical protein
MAGVKLRFPIRDLLWLANQWQLLLSIGFVVSVFAAMETMDAAFGYKPAQPPYEVKVRMAVLWGIAGLFIIPVAMRGVIELTKLIIEEFDRSRERMNNRRPD